MEGGDTMKPIKPIYVLIIIIIFAAGGFYGGVLYGKQSVVQDANIVQGGRVRTRAFGGNAQGMRPVSGQIIAQDSKSITVKLMDGSSKIINFTDQTKINKAIAGSVSDLKSGERVTTFGSTNTDGSVTAQNISIGGGMFRRQQ